MKILTVTSLFPRGTAPTHGVFIKERMKAVAARGAQVRVISPVPWVPPGPVPARYARVRATPAAEEIDGLTVLHPRYLMVPKVGFRMQPGSYARGIQKIVGAEVERFRPDLIDAHYLYPDVCGVAAVARDLGVPFVATARGSDAKLIGRVPFARGRIRAALARAAGVIAVSKDLADAMRSLGLYDGGIDVIRNGIDPATFHPRPRDEARRALGIPGTGRHLVCVAHLAELYGQDLLLRAVAQAGTARDLHVWFVGDGGDRARLESLARSLGLDERVHFQGAVPHAEVPVWFSAADVAVHLHARAGSPNAVLEAMACGARVLASDIPAMREAIPAAHAAALCDLRPDAVVTGLQALLEREATTSAVRTWDDVAADVLACFERARSGHPVPCHSARR